MGRGGQQQTNTSTETTRTTFAPRSADEQALLDQFKELGGAQGEAVQGLLQQLQSPDYSMYSLGAGDQTNLENSYGAAREQLGLANKDFADYLSGGRGMRLSDTPIAQQAMQRQALGNSALESDLARARLDYGFQGNMARNNTLLQGAQALPAGSVAAFNPLFSERMAGGVTRRRGTNFMTGSNTQPLMQTILQGTQAYNQLGQGTQAFAGAGAMMGMSDARLKRNITPVSWTWKDGDDPRTFMGVVAQQVEQEHPHLAQRDANGHLMVDYGTMTAMLLQERELLYQALAQA